MCGRYTITVSLEELVVRFAMDRSSFPYYRPKYNVAPGQLITAIIHDGERNRAGELKWGLVPAWANDSKIGFTMINARSESLAQKPAFRTPLERKRCLIPADSFYEWKAAEGGSAKQPMRVMLKNGALFAMAGLYDTWVTPEGSKLSTCTIITTDANELVGGIHPRMPVIVRPEDEAAWLDRSNRDTNGLLQLLKPYPAEQMRAYPVNAKVGNVKNDTPECIEEIPMLF
ncbi:SOS response-associated peptidase [Paenibacillus sp. HJGM_3]|uniref:SOS response-associated peptidase n=1 Tax=Paenibacillus sp. HJGM_3 TaxID=3379816 RepID=UPI003859099B